MKNTSGCIAWTVVPFDVVAIVVMFVLLGPAYWALDLIGGLIVGSVAWLISLVLLFDGTGEDERG